MWLQSCVIHAQFVAGLFIMATVGVFREIVLEVSADLVRECPGLSMDVGRY